MSEDDFWESVDARCSHVNIGSGTDISIAELAELIAKITGFGGAVEYDASKPDGTPRKLLDVNRARSMGWSAEIELEDGIRQVYRWMLEHPNHV
jgi:GDP-L-fucose synthase